MDFLLVHNSALMFLHLAGAITVLGGLFRAHVSEYNVSDRYNRWLQIGAVALLLSGAAQFWMHLHNAPRYWHMIAGIKILLALHVITVALMLGRDGLDVKKRARLARGAVISGWVVVLLGAVLHNLR